MQASIICPNTYSEPSAWTYPRPTPRHAFDPQIGQTMLANAIEQARAADESGFAYVSISEHHSSPLMSTPNAAIFGGALSQVLTNAKIAWLGPLVSINNPIRVAEEISMLDQLTGGRLIILPLRGTPGEHAIYNNVDPAETRAVTEEATLLIRQALTEREPFAWKSPHFDYPVVSVWPGQTQVPHPPIYYSGNSRESVIFAAANHFSIAMSFYSPAQVAELVELYRAEAKKAGWEPADRDILYRGWIAIGDTDDEARDIARNFMPNSSRPPVPAPKEIGTDADGAKHQGADEDVAGFGFGSVQFCGSPDSILRQFEDFHATTGAGILDLSFGRGRQDTALAAIRRFGQHVVPAMQQITTRPDPVAA